MQARKTLPQAVVGYLGKIYQTQPSYFENLFYSNLGVVTSRLFDDAFCCVAENEMLELDELMTPDLQRTLLDQFVTAQTLEQAKAVAESFFSTVTAMPEWDAFWKEVTKTISCQYTPQHLLKRIAHAFAYKLLSKAHADAKEQNEFIAALDPLKAISLSEAVVGFLDRVHQHHPELFANLFCGTGERLFYDKFNCIDAPSIRVIATVITPEMQKNCVDIFNPINPMLSVSLLHQIRDSAGVCFLSVSLSVEWKEFWNKLTQNTLTSPQRQQALFNIIAGAFTFKVLSLAMQTNKEYYNEKLSLPQRFFLPKLFLNDGDIESDAKFIADHQREIFNLLICSQLNYNDYFNYIKSHDEKNTLFVHDEWRRCLREVLGEARIKSQGEAAYIALNEWLLKAVNKMKELDAKHKDSLRNFCALISDYLETNYAPQTVLSSSQLHSAILLCAATRELAEHIKSKTYQTKLKFMSQSLEGQQSKLVRKAVPQLIPGSTSTMPLPLSPAMKSPARIQIAKTRSTDNLQAYKVVSPRQEESPMTLSDPAVAPDRPASARKYSDGHNNLFKRTTSILGLSSRVRKEKESPRENVGSPPTP